MVAFHHLLLYIHRVTSIKLGKPRKLKIAMIKKKTYITKNFAIINTKCRANYAGNHLTDTKISSPSARRFLGIKFT